MIDSRRRRRRPRFPPVLRAHTIWVGLAAICLALTVLTVVRPLASRVVSRVQPAQPAQAAVASPPAHIEDDPTGLPSVLAAQTPDGPCVTVPILYYHYIRVNPVRADVNGFKLSVTPDNFRKQMALLAAEGAHTLTLDQVMSALSRGRGLPAHPVVLTFDDGHDDFATVAAPILKADGLQATVFVVPGFFGLPHYMTEAQVQEVAAEGFVVGAHTLHHVDLTTRQPALARLEIEASRASLQQLTGQPVLDFAYPYGKLNPLVEQMVVDSGFRDAVATSYGFSQCYGARFALHRVEVTGYAGLRTFAQVAGLPVLPPPDSIPGPVPAPSPRASGSPRPAGSASPSPRPSPSPSPSPAG